MIVPLLREMRAEMKAGFGALDTRLERIEQRTENIRQAAFGESVMGRYMVAEVEERLEAIEKRLAAIETGKN
ncbi:MAG: hypothetical protein ACRDBH_04105 [Bosea sp. (in: a-proteobacteria)]